MWRLEKQAAADAENELSSEVIRTTIYNEPDAEYYSEPQFPTRELPPLPAASHTNGPTDNIINSEPQIDSGMSSSDVTPSLVVKEPYSGLDSSTREPPLSPASYDSLVKPIYYNTNAGTSELTNDICCDEERNDSGILMQKPVSTSSEAETTM